MNIKEQVKKASLISPSGLDENGRMKSGWANVDGGHTSREQMALQDPEARRAMIERYQASFADTDKRGRLDRKGSGEKEWVWEGNMFASATKRAKQVGKLVSGKGKGKAKAGEDETVLTKEDDDDKTLFGDAEDSKKNASGSASVVPVETLDRE